MNLYEDPGWQKAFSTSTARTASACGSCDCQTQDGPNQGRTPVCCGTNFHSLLAQGLPKRRVCGTEGPKAGPETTVAFGWSSGGNDCASDQRPLPRPVETSLCSVDTRGSAISDCQTIWHLAFDMDRWAVSETLGLYPAETASARLRTKPTGCQTLAARGLSGYPTAGSRRTCRNPLGRRNGPAIRSSGRTQLRPQRANAGNSGHGQAVWLQHDIHGYQPGPTGVYGVHRAIHVAGDDRVSSSAGQTESSEGVFDCGWPSGASVQMRPTLGTATQQEYSAVLLARLQPTVESGRVSQPGCQDQCGGSATAKGSAGNDAPGTVVSAKYSTPTSGCQKLFSS